MMARYTMISTEIGMLIFENAHAGNFLVTNVSEELQQLEQC
jgi:hypothetical protein